MKLRYAKKGTKLKQHPKPLLSLLTKRLGVTGGVAAPNDQKKVLTGNFLGPPISVSQSLRVSFM